MAKLDFLGTGFDFPFRFGPTGGLKKIIGIGRASDVASVNASIRYILSTQIGERPMRRDFGSQIRELVFEPSDPRLDIRINYFIQNSIAKWEKRIIINDIMIDRRLFRDGKLLLSITYTIISSQVKGNLVFPFYINEITLDTNAGLTLNVSPN